MTRELEIYFADLTPESQREVLDFFGLSDEEDGNFDDFPIAVLEVEDD